MASSSSRPELPDVTSSLFQEWVAEASAEFGSNFSEEFGLGWVYDKAHIYRGNKVRKDVAAIFSAMWRALEQRHPTLHSSDTSLSDWLQWPVARELQQMSASSLQHQKPIGDSLTVLYSSESIEQMDRMCRRTGAGFPLQAEVNANPPLLINKHRRGGLRQEQESYRTGEGPIAFQGQSASSSSREASGDVLSEAWRYCAAEQRGKIFSSDEKTLHRTLSLISWNAGSVRQQLDVGTFCSKSFVCGVLQEGCRDQQEQLERCRRCVFKRKIRRTQVGYLRPKSFWNLDVCCMSTSRKTASMVGQYATVLLSLFSKHLLTGRSASWLSEVCMSTTT